MFGKLVIVWGGGGADYRATKASPCNKAATTICELPTPIPCAKQTSIPTIYSLEILSREVIGGKSSYYLDNLSKHLKVNTR